MVCHYTADSLSVCNPRYSQFNVTSFIKTAFFEEVRYLFLNLLAPVILVVAMVYCHLKIIIMVSILMVYVYIWFRVISLVLLIAFIAFHDYVFKIDSSIYVFHNLTKQQSVQNLGHHEPLIAFCLSKVVFIFVLENHNR